MHLAIFATEILPKDKPQTHALDSVATRIGFNFSTAGF
jgi:hypothetical protein